MSTEAQRHDYANHLMTVFKVQPVTSDYVVRKYWLARDRLKTEPITEIDKYLLSFLQTTGIPERSIHLAHSLLSAGFLGKEVKTLQQIQAETQEKSVLNGSDSKPFYAPKPKD
jgi:hypothetical protein